MNVTRAVLPVMRRQRSGHLFTIASMGGYLGGSRGTAYAASKFAVASFTESLALELEEFGITATIVGPGYFRTDFLDKSSNALRYAAIRASAWRNVRVGLLPVRQLKQQRGDSRDSVRSRKHTRRLLHFERVSAGAAPMFTGVCIGAGPIRGSCSGRGPLRACAPSQSGASRLRGLAAVGPPSGIVRRG